MARCEEPLFYRKYDGEKFRWVPVTIAVVVLDTIVAYNERENLLVMRHVNEVTSNNDHWRNELYSGNVVEFPKPKRF